MEQRLIDGDALIDDLRKAEEGSLAAAKIIQATEQYSAESITATSFSVVRDVVNDAPTIDPVKHGRWIYNTDDFTPKKRCSHCGYNKPVAAGDRLTQEPENYCPNCGSKMNGGTT